MMKSHLERRKYPGNTLLIVMVFGTVAFVLMVLGVLSYALFEHKISMEVYRRDVAFHIGEAGINYYRWHLAHNPTDFADGTGQVGQTYTHTLTDKFDVPVGTYAIGISSPLPNSSVIAVASTGTVLSSPNANRTLKVRLGFPSFTDSAFIENVDMEFSATTQVHGDVMSNGGIRFDGITDSWLRSAKTTYNYQGVTKNGIWGIGGPTYYWQFPVPTADFASVSADLAEVKAAAQSGGKYLLSSGKEGYQIVFNNTQYTVYKVNTRDCYYGEGSWRRNWQGWYWNGTTYCYDVGTRSLVGTYTLPANGTMFIEDNTWLEGTVDGRITIGVGNFPVPSDYKEVFISNNLLQKQKSSDDVIGIIAQGDIIIPYEAPSTMEVDAAALSQYAKIFTPYYNPNEHAGALKNSLTFFGSQISYSGGGWKYVTGQGTVVSGYYNTNHVYDGNLKYYPPPGFPVGSTYELISWEEVK